MFLITPITIFINTVTNFMLECSNLITHYVLDNIVIIVV